MTRERLVRKLEGYQALYEAEGHAKKLGIRNFRVLTATKSPERAVNLSQAAAKIPTLQDNQGRF